MADSARGIINTYLNGYGLGDLAGWAWKKYLGGDSIEEIMLEMRTTAIYKNRYPAMEELRRQGRAFSEDAYRSFEQSMTNLAVQYGLPTNIYTSRTYVADLLVKGVGLPEFQARAELAQAASTTTPPEYREAAGRLYGVTPGQWTSMWLETDKTLPELEKQFAAATIAGEATMATLGDLSRNMAERLVEAGITREQARQGLTRASEDLGRRLPGEKTGLGTDTLVAGALGIGDEAKQFSDRVRRRTASYMGGGGAYVSERGIGLGSTSR